MYEIRIIDSTNQPVLILNSEKICGKVNAFNKAHIIDMQNNFYQGIFIFDCLEGIEYDVIGKHGGVKHISIFDVKGECLFLLDDSKIITSVENFLKAELIIFDTYKTYKYISYFNKGRIKLNDFVLEEIS
jgi:hypothetical protein